MKNQLFQAFFYLILLAFCILIGIILNLHCISFSFHLNLIKFSALTNPQEQEISITQNRVESKDQLNPPSAMHTMNDKELLRRALMTPAIIENSHDRVPKIAFMFLVKNKVELAPLWAKFFKGNEGLFSIYIHSSPSSTETEPQTSVFHNRRIPSKEVGWGKVNMIEAERRLLANALLDGSNERFVLLSESCIPVYNFSTVYTYLTRATKSFVQVYDQPGAVGRGRYNHRMYPHIKSKQWRKGSQWFEVNRDLARRVVSDNKYFPVFQQHCHGNCYSDEHYLPTFLHIKHRKKNSDRSLTWVDWSRTGPHPGSFQGEQVNNKFLEKIRSGSKCDYNGLRKGNVCFLFARKFKANALDRLMNLSQEVLHY